MMLSVLSLTLGLILEATCASQPISQARKENANQNTPQALEGAKASPKRITGEVLPDAGKQKAVPVAFKRIDFRNFHYPMASRGGTIKLKDGTYEVEDRKGIGGDTFNFERVDYVDLTGEGEPEAIVDLLWVSCGGSCDGGSHVFYFFAIKHGKLRMLQQIATGSLAYDCGLRSFVLSGRKLALELFRTCQFSGRSFKHLNNADDSAGKFVAQTLTRFVFEFNGRKFGLKKREVFPNRETDVKNYHSQISISND